MLEESDEEAIREAGRAELNPSAPAAASSCPNCGMERAEWSEPEGYRKESLLYCCSGCALDTGCVCFHPATRRAAPPPRSRRQDAVPGVRGPGPTRRKRSPPKSSAPSGPEPGTLGDEGGAGETLGSGPREG